MSDLFKDHKPELSEDEDRRLWQRVRAIPGEAEGAGIRPARTPWWRALWAMPSVRYGAPALAALVAAVIWVTERAPSPTLKVESRREAARTISLPPQAQDAPLPQSNPAPARDQVVTAPAAVAIEPLPAARKSAANRSSTTRDQSSAEPKTRLAALRDDALRQDERAAGAAAEQGAQGAKPEAAAPAPAKGTVTQELHVRGGRGEEVFAQPPAAAQQPPTQESERLTFRLPTNLIADRLAQGSLPDPAALDVHPLIREVVGAAALVGDAPLPLGVAEREGLIVAIDVMAGGRIEAKVSPVAKLEKETRQRAGARVPSYDTFEDAPPLLQAAVLAFALERALARPASVPRDRIDALLSRARRVARRADASTRPGAERLVRMTEGALLAWPTP